MAVASGDGLNNSKTNSCKEGAKICTGDEGEEPEQKIISDGGRKSKYFITAQQMRYKKINIAETAVRQKELKVSEISWQNEILLFSKGPGGSKSEMGKECFP